MFNLSFEELKTMGAEITTREIKQQPELWQEVFDYFISKKSEIEEFLKKVVVSSGGKKVKVIFTGAGTSEYMEKLSMPIFKNTVTQNILTF